MNWLMETLPVPRVWALGVTLSLVWLYLMVLRLRRSL